MLHTAIKNDARAWPEVTRGGNVEAGIAMMRESLGAKEYAGLRRALQSCALDDWPTMLVDLCRAMAQFGTRHPWWQATARNILLADAGICPLVHYAFGVWFEPDSNWSTQRWVDVAELSATYLYRLADSSPRQLLDNCRVVARGAYSTLQRPTTEAAERVYKVPSNLAAREFVLGREAEVLELCTRSDLAPHVPQLHWYRAQDAVICREFVDGEVGHDVLVRCNGLSETQVTALRVIYQRVVQVCHTQNIRLDIHPGNFVWCEKSRAWSLIDLGEVPCIGFDYYPIDSFDRYIGKVWLERVQRMKAIPIRSVFLDQEAAC